MSTAPEQFHEGILEASMSGDLEKIVAHFADNAVVMPPNDSTLYGLAEIRAWWTEYFQHIRSTASVETEREITSADEQLIDRRSVSITIVPTQSGARIRDDVRSLTIWKRQIDGSWKISYQMWNSTKPVGSGTNRYVTRILNRKPTHRPA
jgi:ketosteroid isomerase-like protein